MSAGNWFWILYVVCLLFNAGVVYQTWPAGKGGIGHLALWILIALLGYQVFGAVVK